MSAAERSEAPRLYRHLGHIAAAIKTGRRDFAALEEAARSDLENNGWRVDYVSLRNAATLLPATPEDRELVTLAAAWLGKTRLIDNVEISW